MYLNINGKNKYSRPCPDKFLLICLIGYQGFPGTLTELSFDQMSNFMCENPLSKREETQKKET